MFSENMFERRRQQELKIKRVVYRLTIVDVALCFENVTRLRQFRNRYPVRWNLAALRFKVEVSHTRIHLRKNRFVQHRLAWGD